MSKKSKDRGANRAAGDGKLRKAVVSTALKMSNMGLSPGRAGNVSARFGKGMLITPSGLAYDETSPDDIVYMELNGDLPSGQLKPSSEWPFHASAYLARPDMKAHVHTHSPKATTLACARLPIPAFHYMVAKAGAHEIPLMDYATFGTDELAEKVAEGVRAADACLLSNHGVCALGETLDSALELAAEVENLAAQYIDVLLLDRAHILPDDEMEIVLKKFGSYGQKAQSGN